MSITKQTMNKIEQIHSQLNSTQYKSDKKIQNTPNQQ